MRPEAGNRACRTRAPPAVHVQRKPRFVSVVALLVRSHGTHKVFNNDQGSQFTSDAFTGMLKREGITIGMDGRGRGSDNILVERLWRNPLYPP